MFVFYKINILYDNEKETSESGNDKKIDDKINDDKNIINEIDNDIRKLLAPYIDNIIVTIGEDKYYLVTKKAKLSDNTEDYQNNLKFSAVVTFDIYKNRTINEE